MKLTTAMLFALLVLLPRVALAQSHDQAHDQVHGQAHEQHNTDTDQASQPHDQHNVEASEHEASTGSILSPK